MATPRTYVRYRSSATTYYRFTAGTTFNVTFSVTGQAQALSANNVTYVVMGHTHKPMMEVLSPATTYVNLGNWTVDSMTEQAAPCTHLVIRRSESGQPEARLCGWDGQTGPRVLHRDELVSAVVEGSEPAAVRGVAGSLEPGAQPPNA